MKRLVASCELHVGSCELRVARCELKTTWPRISLATHNSQRATRSQGFTFIEVLFAVILLGIGFIMIAAVFPVAIQQTAVVSDETQASAICRDAIKKIQAVADATVTGPASTNTLFPQTNSQVWPIATTSSNASLLGATNTGLLTALGADAFFSADHRYGWVGFYSRTSNTAPYAQVYIVALENPNFANYLYTSSGAGQTSIPAAVPPPVPPAIYGYSPYTPPSTSNSIQASVYYGSDSNTYIVLTYPQTQTSPNGATGAFVLIAANGTGTAPPANMIGRFFRLGTLTTTVPNSGYTTAGGGSGGITQIYQLQPGYDLTPSDIATYGFTNTNLAFSASVYIIGAAPILDSPQKYTNDYTGPFSGGNQDIGVATGFVRVNTANN
jgi:type II secretory pathway pseudopilin PulG